jgi:hypothetical protein
MSNYCENYFHLIEDLVEGELDEQSVTQVDSHIFACSKCQKEYETLRREKEIYAHYLFDLEPPPDSWINFQVRLIAEKEKAPGDAIIPLSSSRRRKRIFVFSFSPALAVLGVLLFICGIGFILLKNGMFKKDGDKYIADTRTDGSRSPLKSGVTDEQPTADSAVKITGGNETTPPSNESVVNNQTLKTRNNFPAHRKSFAADDLKTRGKSLYSSGKKNPLSKVQPDENELVSLRTKKLETEIAGQIEKVELLLRSFRNARSVGSVDNFDVEYERMQARKLLGKNERLRRDAENYGTSYSEELLSRVEPYLLDIANLETNPAPDKVMKIKERVSSQNIIASLQVYCCAETR